MHRNFNWYRNHNITVVKVTFQLKNIIFLHSYSHRLGTYQYQRPKTDVVLVNIWTTKAETSFYINALNTTKQFPNSLFGPVNIFEASNNINDSNYFRVYFNMSYFLRLSLSCFLKKNYDVGKCWETPHTTSWTYRRERSWWMHRHFGSLWNI